MSQSFTNQTIHVSNSDLDANFCTIYGSNNKILGFGNKILGSNNNIKGNENDLLGSNNTVKGDKNTVNGSNNDVKGDKNNVTGSNNNIKGRSNTVRGSNNTIHQKKRRVQRPPPRQRTPSTSQGRVIVNTFTNGRLTSSVGTRAPFGISNSTSDIHNFTEIANGIVRNIVSSGSVRIGKGGITVTDGDSITIGNGSVSTSTATQNPRKRKVDEEKDPLSLLDLEGPTTETDIERLQCSICLENEKNVKLLPCNHLCVCISCARRLYETPKCPICREKIEGGEVVFIS